MSSALLARIAELQERNDALEAELGNLRDALSVEYRIWIPGVHLTRREATMFGVLMKREIASREAIMHALYGDVDDRPEVKIVDVLICHVRRKIRGYNVRIETCWGIGFFLSAAAKRAVEAGEVHRVDAELPQDFPPDLVEPEPVFEPEPALEPTPALPAQRRKPRPTAERPPRFLWGDDWRRVG
ncbi:helix-turn-helix domain-containing protein [Hansschlegelia zhihuaiae]|uniref:Helix-turn-helix domain-containing protein n=1 Tax=Hansschlegelia zhihuaiae TaxID=405005 RepID=A0A4V1KJQ9_9HYPH|nr:helix-turn-helix domain-containing protein [Hansschlegelia zhihuaiae]RXF75052.1 helix-turn-helix domain-containing protein [Hansschlegelia zhihuaiae]